MDLETQQLATPSAPSKSAPQDAGPGPGQEPAKDPRLATLERMLATTAEQKHRQMYPG